MNQAKTLPLFAPFFSNRLFSKKNRIWTLLIILFLISRFTLILWGYQKIHEAEDKEQGYIAIELLSGARAPILDYQVDTYSGGTLIYGVLGAAFIYLFGLSVFSLKLVALLFNFAAFILMLFFMKRFFGMRTAVYAALLWIFAPPVLTSTSLMALGSHECLFPIMGLLYAFCFYVCEKKLKSRVLALGVTGFFTGLAITFSYITFIALACFLVILIYIKRFRFSAAEVLSFICGLSIGGFLWIAYNMNHNFAGLHYLVESGDLTSPRLGGYFRILKRPFAFFLRLVPYGFSFRPWPGIPYASVPNYIYFIIPAALIFSDMARAFSQNNTPDKARVPLYFFRAYLLLFPIFFAFASQEIFLMASFPFNYRYMIHYYCFGLLYVAALLPHLRHRRILLGFLLAIGFFSQAKAVWGKPFGEVFNQLAFKSGLRDYVWEHPSDFNFNDAKSFTFYAASLNHHSRKERRIQLCQIANDQKFWSMDSPQNLVQAILSIPDKNTRRYFFRKWGIRLELNYSDADLSKLFKLLLQTIPEPYQMDFTSGVGRGCDVGEYGSLLKFAEVAGPRNSLMLYLAHGNGLFRTSRNFSVNDTWKPTMKSIAHLPEPQKTWIYRGVGTAMYRSFRFQEILQKNFDFLGDTISKENYHHLYWGIGWYLGRRYWYDSAQGLERLERLDPVMRDAARDGFNFFHSMTRVAHTKK